MKNATLLLWLSLLFGCQSTRVDPGGEVEATIVSLTLDPAVYCTCCQGYRVQVGARAYWTNHVPSPFDQPGTRVWLRYTQPESDCGSTQAPDRLQITAIRAR